MIIGLCRFGCVMCFVRVIFERVVESIIVLVLRRKWSDLRNTRRDLIVYLCREDGQESLLVREGFIA